jgi:hypothetical protein
MYGAMPSYRAMLDREGAEGAGSGPSLVEEGLA